MQKSIPYLLPQWRQNGYNRYPIYDQNGWKTIPFRAAHTYIVHEGIPPPPGQLRNSFPFCKRWPFLKAVVVLLTWSVYCTNAPSQTTSWSSFNFKIAYLIKKKKKKKKKRKAHNIVIRSWNCQVDNFTLRLLNSSIQPGIEPLKDFPGVQNYC